VVRVSGVPHWAESPGAIPPTVCQEWCVSQTFLTGQSLQGQSPPTRQLVQSCSRRGTPGGGVRARGRTVGRAARCLPAVKSRACVDTWAGTASGGSLRTVAPVAVCNLGLLLYGELVDYGNAPDNAYSQGDQELNASSGAC
jgi:hypothetical protein